MCEDSIHLYLDQLASNEPVPGGGSASAVCGALGAALLEMVCNFTIGKEKFKAVEQDVAAVLKKATSARERLRELIDEDKAAYLPVAQAYKMPKETDEQKSARKVAIAAAFEGARKVPMEIKALCEGLLGACDELEEKGNQLLVGDVRCGRELLQAAIKGASNFI